MSEFAPLNFPADHHLAGPERWFCVLGGKVLVSDRSEFGGERYFVGVLEIGRASCRERVYSSV